jgi:hypothetical protein
MAMSQRRVVMGRRAELDVIVADGLVAPVELAPGGVSTHPIWGRDVAEAVPTDGSEPSQSNGFPPVTGFRYAVLTIPAGTDGAYHSFIETALAPLAGSDRPGLHWTPTIDCIVVTEGQLLLEGDEGSVTVCAGNSVIINGNRHRWSNSGDQAAVLHAISIGVESGR